MLISKIKDILIKLRFYGLRGSYKKFKKKYSSNESKIASESYDIIKLHESFTGYSHGLDSDRRNIKKGTLQWVIPNFGFGSGGHLNIFRFMKMMSDLGYQNHLVILGEHDWQSEKHALKALNEWYQPLETSLKFGVEGFLPSEYTLATGWQTAYWVKKYRATDKRFYFVQDFEPDFYPKSSESILAENTYKLGLIGVTAGSWLKEKLSKEYGMACHALSFSYEKDLYFPRAKRKNNNFNILFYSRHVTPRRMFEIGLVSVHQLCKKYKDIAVIFAGGDVSKFKIDFHHLNAGALSINELPDLYSQCDLALVLSGTNLSLLPMEIAACQCPLVLNEDPSASWLLPKDAAFYSKLESNALFKKLEIAYLDKNLRESTAKKGLNFALKSSWDEQATKLKEILESE